MPCTLHEFSTFSNVVLPGGGRSPAQVSERYSEADDRAA